MKCLQCNIEYRAYDIDAGTYREKFCSKKCEGLWEKLIGKAQNFILATGDPYFIPLDKFERRFYIVNIDK